MTAEQKTYRIIRKHLKLIMKLIPFEQMTALNYTTLIPDNIKLKQIEVMYKDMYTTVGFPYYKEQSDKLEKLKFFSENVFNEIISLWLQQNAGQSIVSVHQTLIETVLQIINDGYANNLSTQQIAKALQSDMGLYRYQALRIARTESTTITNAATLMAGNSSRLVLEKTWISARDNRTRRPPKSKYDHYDMDGVTVGEYEKFLVSGEEVDFPGAPKISAGNRINCRCKVVLVPKLDMNGDLIRKI